MALQGLGFHQVALVPNAPNRSTYIWYKTAMTDFGGRFEFTDVAPGEYKVFAWLSAPDGAWTSADYLRKFEDRGTPAAVKVGQQLKDLTVNLIQ
jgi:hypothetical protein